MRKKLLNMGIDPNNHKVNQIPSSQQPQPDHVSAVVASMNEEDACKTKIPADIHNDRVSDARSSLEDETSAGSGSFNLNLDLTIAVPWPSLTFIDEEKPRTTTNECKSDGLTTLPLFQ